MVGVLAPRPVDRGFEPQLSHAKDYKIGTFVFVASHQTLSIKE
jgi:hypothetical protein